MIEKKAGEKGRWSNLEEYASDGSVDFEDSHVTLEEIEELFEE